MTRTHPNGFAMIELMVIVAILGTVLAFAIPNYRGYAASHNLHGAADNFAGQLRIAREKAIATGVKQEFHTAWNWQDSDYHIHNNGIVHPKWRLPKGISYVDATAQVFDWSSDGKCSNSASIIFQDFRGKRDTVSVLMSGLIIHR